MVLSWPAIGYLLLGVLIGIFFGAVPGLGGITALAIMLPFTYTMSPPEAFAFLLGMFAITTTSDAIPAILLSVPGTVAGQATILDGHPMALKGQAARALGAAFSCSAVGGLIGAFFLALSVPVIRPIILAFASPEFFLLGCLGLTMIGVLSGNSVLKGIVAALLGLMLSLVGYAEIGAVPRYHFGVSYLLDKLPLVPMVLGLYAVPELLRLTRDLSISKLPHDPVNGSVLKGVRDAFVNWSVLLRSGLVGIYIGLLPGLGGSIADWAAYAHIVQTSRDKSKFGKGDVRGVLASEVANHSVKGAALVPTVVLGIPESAPYAILLGAFLIQGIRPGPEMLTTHLDLTFSLVWTLVIANMVASGGLLLCANQIARLTFIKGHLIVPVVIAFIFMGAWMATNQMGDWICLLSFGVFGYFMKISGFPRPPFILGFVLGPILENAFFISKQAYPGMSWLSRPVSLALLALILITIVASARVSIRHKIAGSDLPQTTEVEKEDPLISVPVIAAALLIFVGGAVIATGYPRDPALFPLVISLPGSVLALVALYFDVRALRPAWQSGTAAGSSFLAPFLELRSALLFILSLAAIPLASLIIDQRLAIAGYVIGYLVIMGRYGWRFALIYGSICFAVIDLIFDRLASIVWYSSLFQLP
jgi:putative tricarboxylic transport membrane protein